MLELSYMFMETLTKSKSSTATCFAMAQNAPYGHIDPPPEACISSQDTVEDLDLYKDQVGLSTGQNGCTWYS